MNFLPVASVCFSSLVLKDGLGYIPQCNPPELGHTLGRANMWRGMYAAQQELVSPQGHSPRHNEALT